MTQFQLTLGNFPISASSNSIETHVKNVRIKIDGGSKKSLIRTIRGVGYALDLRDVWPASNSCLASGPFESFSSIFGIFSQSSGSFAML